MSDVSAQELRTIRLHNLQVAQHVKTLHIAIAASTDLEFGMSRMHETLTDMPGWTVGVFRTVEQAREWLTAVVSSPAPTFKT